NWEEVSSHRCCDNVSMTVITTFNDPSIVDFKYDEDEIPGDRPFSRHLIGPKTTVLNDRLLGYSWVTIWKTGLDCGLVRPTTP
ncbi:unnamed protein product, partial [Ilex paraguariensis]